MGLHDRIKGGENGSDPEEQAAVNLVGPDGVALITYVPEISLWGVRLFLAKS